MKMGDGVESGLHRLQQELDSLKSSIVADVRTALASKFPDTPVSVRIKDSTSFMAKAQKRRADGQPKYAAPLIEIHDILGIRVLCKFGNQVEQIAELLKTHLRYTEETVKSPDSHSEFGYFGKHYLFHFPPDKAPKETCSGLFELQIKTLFQHAWSEANHDLLYKARRTPPPKFARLAAFAAAQAWGADQIFDQLQVAMSAPANHDRQDDDDTQEPTP